MKIISNLDLYELPEKKESKLHSAQRRVDIIKNFFVIGGICIALIKYFQVKHLNQVNLTTAEIEKAYSFDYSQSTRKLFTLSRMIKEVEKSSDDYKNEIEKHGAMFKSITEVYDEDDLKASINYLIDDIYTVCDNNNRVWNYYDKGYVNKELLQVGICNRVVQVEAVISHLRDAYNPIFKKANTNFKIEINTDGFGLLCKECCNTGVEVKRLMKTYTVCCS